MILQLRAVTLIGCARGIVISRRCLLIGRCSTARLHRAKSPFSTNRRSCGLQTVP